MSSRYLESLAWCLGRAPWHRPSRADLLVMQVESRRATAVSHHYYLVRK